MAEHLAVVQKLHSNLAVIDVFDLGVCVKS